MRQMTMQHIWIDGDKVDWADRVEGLAKKLWRYGWGLLFVLIMALLAEYGPRTVYSKVASDSTVSSQPVHYVK